MLSIPVDKLDEKPCFVCLSSAIDKLDKEPWEAVRAEMTEEKGLPMAVADKIGEFVQHR
jgi:histidyl-tRNA synthetase